MRLMLLRHGQTPYNVAGALDTGRPGAGLTDLGHAQARALPDALGDESIAAIYASALIRTQLTATPLAETHASRRASRRSAPASLSCAATATPSRPTWRS